MSLQPISGFKTFTTHHCVTGSMRHIYEFHHYPISEDLLLGLGSGIGFVYWYQKGISPIFGGRANFERPGEKGMEKTAGERTGVKVQSFYTSSARKAERTLLDLLAAGEPAMICADMGFLPYFDFPEDFHFGGHVIVVAGHDSDSRQVLVADRDGVLHPVSLEALAKARGSTFKPFPPRNALFAFDFSNKRPPKPEEVRQAINEAVSRMLHPPIANIGVKGIRTAAKRVLEWPKIMTEAEVRDACTYIDIYIDAKGGTGGGIFRYMYGRFLKEAANIIRDRHLVQIGEELRLIGDQWQAVAKVFTEAAAAPVPAKLLPEAATLIRGIADREQSIWEKLDTIINHKAAA